MRVGSAMLFAAVLCFSACPKTSGRDAGTGGGAGGGSGEDASVEFDAGFDAGQPVVDSGTPDAGPIELRINRLLPPRGATAGGTTVLMEGSGFLRGVATSGTQAKPLTTLKLGSNQVQDFQIIDDGTLELRTPPGVAGNVSVTLQNPNGGINCNNCFTYFEQLAVTSFTPTTGPLAGGNEVTLTGTGFTNDTQVLFGSYSSPVTTFVSATELKALAPRGLAAGPVDLVVYNKNGVSNQRRAYSYRGELRVSSIAPVTGGIAGGDTVTLTGSGFTGATEVRFGGTPGTALTVSSDSSLTVQTPATAAGAVDVTVVTPSGNWTTRNGFTFFDATGSFAAFALSPRLIREGDVVTLTGQALDTAGLTVSIGGVAATVTGTPTFSTLQVTVPSRGAAPRVSEVLVGGAQSATLTGAATWRVQLTAATPNVGPSSGGAAVTVAGAAIPPAVTLTVGALAGAGVTVNSESEVALTTPAGSGGAPSAIRVVDAADVENDALLANGFTFEEPLSIGRVQPERGAIAGNTLVTVLGSGFGDAMRVKFGTGIARDFKFIDSHTITCRTPKANAGVVDVRVERLAEFDVLPGGFSFFDPRSVAGGLSGGPMAGTLNVTVLSGDSTDYTAPVPGATVMIGTDPTTPFQGVTDYRGQITFSDATLVKAELVTVFKDFWTSASVSNVNAENLTLFLNRTGGGEPGGGGGTPIYASVITGTVVGFKSPRPLQPTESLEARVFVAQTSVLYGPPFNDQVSHQQELWRVSAEGGAYRVFTLAGLRATYALLGIVNSSTNTFTPISMGIKRGITTSNENPASDQTIVLDTALDTTVPLSIDGPLSCVGSPCINASYAWLELGAEGYVPNPKNFDTAMSDDLSSLITSTAPTFGFPAFPRLDGSNFIFCNVSGDASGVSFYFRRQPGDLQSGVTIGPMLPIPHVQAFDGGFGGDISWQTDPGPVPDLYNVEIRRYYTPNFSVVVWDMVLPGTENSIAVPQAAVQKLLREEAGNILFVRVVGSRSPRFAYNQWTYDSLSALTWSSFTQSSGGEFFP